MPFDKWGIPFFYATADDAGVSGEGNGFFWQQNNNIREDQDDGMVRLGKESDDVEVINSSTGEFEFPFASGADYFCMEVRQGHKSGGETHGCEGACYIFNVNITTTPATFYYQKQLYHGGSKFIDPNSGTTGHPTVTEDVVGSGWKGMAAVIYNKENGRASGKHSAILETWWNEDPVADIKNWVKVKTTEDKGGWGNDGDSCDGDDDQVITWSNVQFRFKSGTPDFSLHPLIPEFEDGPVIHSIGGADMSFSDSENRGYGKRADMPANVEMKCLFKFDSNNGICRLKNLSLREIDPTKSFDETPTDGGPVNTQTIQGSFKLQWDLNTSRASACAIASGGTIPFYTITGDTDLAISNNTVFSNRIAAGESIVTSASPIVGHLLKSLVIPLKKAGTPGASPLVEARIYNSSGTSIYTSPTTFDPSAFTTSFVDKTFDFSTNTHVFVSGDFVGVRYAGTSSSNYVVARYQNSNTIANSMSASIQSGVIVRFSNAEFACTMYE